MIYLKIRKLLKVFLFKSPVQFCNRGADLSTNNAVPQGWDNIKVDSQNAVKKVLDLQKSDKFKVNSNFSLEICCKHNKWPETVSIHYSGAFYIIFLSFLF